MTKQQELAVREMTQWLALSPKFQKLPVKIEIAGEFDLYGRHYYVIKFKKTLLGAWLLGVAGGFTNEEDTSVLYVTSNFTEYQAKTARDKARVMIANLVEQERHQAQQEELSKEQQEIPFTPKIGPFMGIILLNTHQFDLEAFEKNLKEDWGIQLPEKIVLNESDEKEETSDFVYMEQGAFAIASFVDAPVPGGQAEHAAQLNFLWKEAASVTRTHVAQVMVAVIDQGKNPLELGTIFTQLCASCLKLPNAVGIYTSGTVWEPSYYREMAMPAKDGHPPIMSWVYCGVYRTEMGMCGYTNGLSAFGKDELEILNSRQSASDVWGVLSKAVFHILTKNITLKDGDRITLSEQESELFITRSEGVAVLGKSLKIAY